MLVLDVLDDWVPAAVVVDQVAVTWCVHNVQSQAHSVLFNNMRYDLNVGGLADWLIWCKAALRAHKMGGEDGVDESGLSKTSLS